MRKTIYLLSSLLVFTALFFTSCKKKDDEVKEVKAVKKVNDKIIAKAKNVVKLKPKKKGKKK